MVRNENPFSQLFPNVPSIQKTRLNNIYKNGFFNKQYQPLQFFTLIIDQPKVFYNHISHITNVYKEKSSIYNTFGDPIKIASSQDAIKLIGEQKSQHLKDAYKQLKTHLIDLYNQKQDTNNQDTDEDDYQGTPTQEELQEDTSSEENVYIPQNNNEHQTHNDETKDNVLLSTLPKDKLQKLQKDNHEKLIYSQTLSQNNNDTSNNEKSIQPKIIGEDQMNDKKEIFMARRNFIQFLTSSIKRIEENTNEIHTKIILEFVKDEMQYIEKIH